MQIAGNAFFDKIGPHLPMAFDAQRISGNSVHGLPNNCKKEEWLKMFIDEKPAYLHIMPHDQKPALLEI